MLYICIIVQYFCHYSYSYLSIQYIKVLCHNFYFRFYFYIIISILNKNYENYGILLNI